MRINNNITAMNTHRQYGINTTSVAKSTEKLSSGYRINRAGDDAAGLAISEKMRAQIRGLKMASKNSQDAISLVQTAEGALQETHNILQRMRELATQSSSDTNETSIDRAALDAEFQQLIAEIDDTALKTKFNDMGVIDGTYGAIITTPPGAGNFQVPPILMASAERGAAGAGSNITVEVDGNNFKITDGTFTSTVAITEDNLKAGAHTIQFEDGTSFTYTLKADETSNANLAANAFGGAAVTFGGVVQAKAMVVQTGANQHDELAITIDKMDASTLGVKNASIASGEDARVAITTVNTAINLVSTQRSKLGALQNRLNHKISNLDTSAENLAAAESRIRDLDMASEMTNFTKNNILVQASTAMLAQANAAPQSVLSLLQ